MANDTPVVLAPCSAAETYFREFADKLLAHVYTNETLLINYVAEHSDFIRINRNKIRQAGNVVQHELQLDLIADRRQSTTYFNLCGVLVEDLEQAETLLRQLRTQLTHLPADPYLHVASTVHNSIHRGTDTLPPAHATLEHIIKCADGLDLVGIWASGMMMRGFASSYGQFNWHSQHNFNFDWSVYSEGDKAVKQAYAGLAWDETIFQRQLKNTRRDLELLRKPAKTIQPGQYRVFLTPTALSELLSLLGWGGFSLKSHRTQQTPLLKMIKDGIQLNPKVTLSEQHATGLTPGFTSEGFSKPDDVILIDEGRYRGCLSNARSAKEYGVEVNCDVESPQSLHMASGSLSQQEIFTALGTGVYISNLWYSNYSDRNHCRMTGMTRFACLWVENGKPVAPLNVMRFDESLYHLLGDKLIALTDEQEQLFDAQSYQRRSERSASLPGALIQDFTFTL